MGKIDAAEVRLLEAAGGESDKVNLFLGLVRLGSNNRATPPVLRANFERPRALTLLFLGGVEWTSGLKVKGSDLRPLAVMTSSSGLGPNS